MTDFTITSFGIETIGNPTLEQFGQAVGVATTMKNSAAWSLGDLYVIGSERFDDEAEQYFDASKVSLATIRNYASVSRAFSPARRKYNVSFSHYREVMTIKDEEGRPVIVAQDELLRQAERDNWNRDHLREQVKKIRGKMESKKTVEAQVGLVDDMLIKDLGLPIGTVVKVTYEIVQATEDKTEDNAA